MELPRRLQRIWKRASSPRGEGVPIISTDYRDPLALEDIEKGRITTRKEKIRAIRRKQILERRKQILSDLYEASIDLGQLEDIAIRNSDRQVVGTGEGENLSSHDRRQWIRVTNRISQRPDFYSYLTLRIRCIALGLPVPLRLSGKVREQLQ